ncbi:sensor histidine kinase [Streptomyces coffeae]|uniref:histidine kinase n=1 Tax=Streptomyces coffeae TaxID=621382 RepID=A0ABS1NRL6_9ACTN|nr:nitrate- and nitrite sensing domain-containing protein [Streptomyces coffeae]MBL1102532.1 nitrate- and nitrite sensing domain-containing protein [Streptomyces coffeae]
MAPRKHRLRRRRSLLTSLLTLTLVPSTALAVIWGETTYQLLSEGVDLAEQSHFGRSIDPKLDNLRWNLEAELRGSSAWLANAHLSHSRLQAQRKKTDSSIGDLGNLRKKLDDAPARVRNSEMPFAEALEQFPLERLRTQIDQRAVSPARVLQAYTSLIGAETTALFAARQVPQGSLVSRAQPVSMLIEIEKAIQAEDAVMAQALPSRRMSTEQRFAFMTPMGAQRSLLSELGTIQTPAQRAELGRLTNSAAWKTLVAVENAVTMGGGASPRSALPLPPAAGQWRHTLDTLESQLQDLIRAETTKLLSAQSDTARDTLRHEGFVSLAGLAAVLVSALLSWRVSRSLLRRMAGLREATLELADRRLPDIVARLNRGETVDVEAEALELDYGTDQVGQVARAFNAVQRTGISSAVALADARRGFQNAILITARRSQNLVNRQLALLDEFERKHQAPDVLGDLYQLDSQASQLRRYEENLLIISGGRPGRRWNEPVPLADVVRSAVGEVSEYQRITVSVDDQVSITGGAVADIIHLLAELVENAANFSPRICPVFVRGDTVGKGAAVEIEDRGIGMREQEYAVLNQRLAEPPPFDVLSLEDDSRLGMFVVARLASRHGITITLRPSPFGGTSAVVLIPEAVLVRAAAKHSGRFRTPVPEGFSANGGPPPATAEPADGPTARPDPVAPGPLVAAATAAPSAPAGRESTRSLPPLPERVPQASLAQELRHAPGAGVTHESDPPQPASAEKAARTLSAFQRGTAQARFTDPKGL